MLVLAVDPGSTTGYAVLDTAPEPLARPISGQLPHMAFQSMVAAEYGDRHDIQLVIERFTLNAGSMRKSREGMHHAIETIGVLRFLAMQEGWPDPEFQLPADVMRIVDNEALRSLGWYARSQGHANDALRHLAVWALKSGRISRKDLRGK